MTRKEQLEQSKKKILQAAQELMEECEVAADVTSRNIAARAGVQLAMINYCFGSREALLYEVFEQANKNYETENKIVECVAGEKTPKDKLRKIYYYVATFLIKEYRFTEAITGYLLLHRDLSQGLHTVLFVTEHFQGKKIEAECKLIAYELSSTVQLALCRRNELKEFCGLDLEREDDLRKYIDFQIDLFLGEN